MLKQYTLGFYNLENLYDTTQNIKAEDRDFIPMGVKKWTDSRYQNKINKLSYAISKIGFKETQDYPLLVGLAEVENKKVVLDMIQMEHLEKGNYGVLHFDSLDERGIDNALIYRKEFFEPLETKPIRIILENQDGGADYTRDILYVSGKLNHTLMHLFVVHMPSKSDNDINKPKRAHIMLKLRYEIDRLFEKDKEAFIVIMGDLNDNPNNEDAQDILKTKSNKANLGLFDLYNPMGNLQKYDRGSMMYKRKWLLFDQFFFSKAFFNEKSSLFLEKVDIFDESFLKERSRRFKGQPFRTFVGTKYLGGYSDHFPVYAIIKA